MITVVVPACTFTPDFSSGTVVLESNQTKDFSLAIMELQEPAARQMAIGYAAQRGVPDPRSNGNPGHPYPINSEGYSLDQVRDEQGQPLPPQHPRMQVARYRADIPVTRRLV